MLTGPVDKQSLIEDLRKVQDKTANKVSRDFYQANGLFSKSAWHKFFQNFAEFYNAAFPDEDLDYPETTAADPGLEVDVEAEPRNTETEPEGDWVYADGYTYNGHTDTYVTYLKSTSKNVVVSGLNHRAMKASYSNWDGSPQTLNQVCRRFGVARKWFHEYKTVHGWTHDSDPFSVEEMKSRTIDDLSNDALEQKRLAVWQETERLKWRASQQDAEKWNKLEQSFIIPLHDLVTSVTPKHVPLPALKIAKARRPFALVTGTGELHYGKSGWKMQAGDEYNREIAAARLRAGINHVIEETSLRGRPDQIVLALGDDYLHVDNANNETTRGTRQDVDGTAARALSEGFELLVETVDLLSQVSPVVVKLSRGNHSRLLEYAMAIMLQAHFRTSSNIQVDVTPMFRSYHRYGSTLMAFHHGDIVKPKDIMQITAVEAKEHWSDTIYRAVFTGHFHDKEVTKLIGGHLYQNPSLSGSADAWHRESGYLSTAAIGAYLVDKDKGVTTTIVLPV